MEKKNILVLLLVFMMLISSACEKSSNIKKNERPIVYTSFYPIYSITKEVVKDKVDLRVFMPVGQDPHLWEPSPKDIKKLATADLLIINGANMEKWIDTVQESLPNLKVLNLSSGVDLITYKGAAALGDFQYMVSKYYKKDTYSIEFGHTHEDSIRVAFYKNDDGLSEDELVKIGKKIMSNDKSKKIKQWETFDVNQGEVYEIEMSHEYGGVSYRILQEGDWIFYSDRVSTDNLSYKLLDPRKNDLDEKIIREESTSGDDKITYDPHSWLSVRNVKRYINDIEYTLKDMYPEHSRNFRKNASTAIKDITDLDFEYRDKFKNIKFREFVVTHYAFAYLARDFDLVQYPLQSLTSMDSPSIKKIRQAIDFVKDNNINTIFYEVRAVLDGVNGASRMSMMTIA